LTNWTAANAPAISAMMYGMTSERDNLPEVIKAIATAGLYAPPEIGPPKSAQIAKAAPIAIQLPVAKMINMRNIVPANSTKYFCIYIITSEKSISIMRIYFLKYSY
jgi:hypothetical protein